jgi:hypothetical protein
MPFWIELAGVPTRNSVGELAFHSSRASRMASGLGRDRANPGIRKAHRPCVLRARERLGSDGARSEPPNVASQLTARPLFILRRSGLYNVADRDARRREFRSRAPGYTATRLPDRSGMRPYEIPVVLVGIVAIVACHHDVTALEQTSPVVPADGDLLKLASFAFFDSPAAEALALGCDHHATRIGCAHSMSFALGTSSFPPAPGTSSRRRSPLLGTSSPSTPAYLREASAMVA